MKAFLILIWAKAALLFLCSFVTLRGHVVCSCLIYTMNLSVFKDFQGEIEEDRHVLMLLCPWNVSFNHDLRKPKVVRSRRGGTFHLALLNMDVKVHSADWIVFRMPKSWYHRIHCEVTIILWNMQLQKEVWDSFWESVVLFTKKWWHEAGNNLVLILCSCLLLSCFDRLQSLLSLDSYSMTPVIKYLTIDCWLLYGLHIALLSPRCDVHLCTSAEWWTLRFVNKESILLGIYLAGPGTTVCVVELTLNCIKIQSFWIFSLWDLGPLFT